MPRTVRPFGDRARPDPEGNVTPYDTPDTAELLERTGNGDDEAAYVILTNEAGIELAPFDLGAVHSIASEDPPFRAPELLIGENPRRGAITVYSVGAAANTRWRIGRSASDVLRDDSSILVGFDAVAVPPTLRVSWRNPLWIVQRDGTVGQTLVVISEEWAR
jgi:hypothetical protein